MAERAEFKCLICHGQHIKQDHICPIGLCSKGVHFDFCKRCSKISVTSFEKQMQSKNA